MTSVRCGLVTYTQRLARRTRLIHDLAADSFVSAVIPGLAFLFQGTRGHVAIFVGEDDALRIERDEQGPLIG